MMARVSPTHAPDGEAGFTLVELLVAMLMSIIVLFGVLSTLDQFTRSASRQTRVTDANDQARKAMDRIVSDLRQAATIEVAGAADLVYTVSDSATATRRERVCLDATNQLWRSSVTTASPPVTPIAAGTPCPTPASGAFRITPLATANTATNRLFRYDSATPANVRSVGLMFALDAGNGGRTDVSTLRASTFVRAKSETALDVDPDEITASCNSVSKVPTLTLAPSVGSATVSYTDAQGGALGSGSAGTAVTLSSATPTATTVVANITTTTGLVTQIIKTLECTT